MVTLKGYTANMLGVSTDQKPTDADINTIFRELDTNKYYYFDGTDWNEIPSSGGGGGFVPTEAQLTAMNSGITSADVQQIGTNENNILSVQTQANWNTNNGVKNLATINNFSNTGYYKDVPVDGSLTGNVTIYIGNIISTDTDANQCAVLFMYTDDTSSPFHLVNRGTVSSFSVNLEAKVLKSVRIYSSDNYVHSSGDTVTVTNLMVCPKSLYDADSTYEPYSLPNTKITPELIELVDSGAKNLLNLNGLTLGLADGFTGQINSDDSVTLSGTTASTASCRIQLGTMTGRYVLSGCPSGGGDSTYRLDIRDSSYNVVTGSLDTGNGSDEFTLPSGSYLYFRFAAGTYNNVKFYPMLCTKAAWDVSQKYVPYRPTYEETVEQVAKCPKILVKSFTQFTSATTLSDTGVSYDLPANKYVRITATARYSGSNPEEIKLGTDSVDFAHVTYTTGDNPASLTVSAYVGGYNSDMTIKVFAKFRQANSNIILLVVEEIPNI